MSRKNIPPEYGDPEGPSNVDTHSNKLSPFGPAEQLLGGSKLISASSFWILRCDGLRDVLLVSMADLLELFPWVLAEDFPALFPEVDLSMVLEQMGRVRKLKGKSWARILYSSPATNNALHAPHSRSLNLCTNK